MEARGDDERTRFVRRSRALSRHVRGWLFSEYVRMIRRRKDIAWERTLLPDDVEIVRQLVHPEGWYPMEIFERLGNAILTEIARDDLDGVRLWGRLSAGLLAEAQPEIVVQDDPVETMMRFKVLRASSFDFDAFQIPVLDHDHARVEIRYHMGARAEEAACHQTMGFCEGLLSLADVSVLHISFEQRAWAGDDRTTMVVRWRSPRRQS